MKGIKFFDVLDIVVFRIFRVLNFVLIRNFRIKVIFIILLDNDIFMSGEVVNKIEELFFIVYFEIRIFIVLKLF